MAEENIRCPKCGAECKLTEKYCGNCGYKIPLQSDISLKKLLISFLAIIILIIGICALSDLINKIQFNNALNKKDFWGNIILIESSNHKFNKDCAIGIQLKLNDKYGNDNYIKIKKYYRNKAIIYASKNIDINTLLAYLNKPLLVFMKRDPVSNRWIETGITDKYIKKSEVSTSSVGTWVVDIVFTDEGKEKFAKVTQEITGQQLAIFFDGELITAPIIREPILGGRAQISGGENGFTLDQAEQIKNAINNGLDLYVLEIKENK